MIKKTINILIVFILVSTIFLFMPTSEASNEYLLDIEDDEIGQYKGSKNNYFAQEFKTNNDEIWSVDSLSFYGKMGGARIEVGIKDPQHQRESWLSVLSLDYSINDERWHTFHIPHITLVPDKTYRAVIRIKSGEIEMNYGSDQYNGGSFFVSTNDGYYYKEKSDFDLFLRIDGSKIQRQSNHYAVFLSCGEPWGKEGAILLKDTINKGFWTDIKIKTSGVTKTDIKNNINWLYEKSKTGDCTLLFYYVGHGEKYGIKDESRKLITDIELQSWFSKFKISDKLILIIESCYSGSLINSKTYDIKQNNFEISKLLKDLLEKIINKFPRLRNIFEINHEISHLTSSIESKEDEEDQGMFSNLVKSGRIVVTACKKRQTAYRLKTGYWSAFTFFLIQELKSTSYIETAFVNAKKYTSEHVINYYGDFQNPQMADRISGTVRIK